MARRDEVAMAAEAAVEDTKAVVEAGITMEAAAATTITMTGVSIKLPWVTVLWHPCRAQEGTSL